MTDDAADKAIDRFEQGRRSGPREPDLGFDPARSEIPDVGAGSTITPTATAPGDGEADELPQSLLVCYQCGEFYAMDDEWDYCPKCGADLWECEQG